MDYEKLSADQVDANELAEIEALELEYQKRDDFVIKLKADKKKAAKKLNRKKGASI